MNLAIATPEDFKMFWSMYRAQQRLDYAESDLEVERCKKIILGRMEQMGAAFTRVVMGCETLIDNCCDQSLDHYDFSPKIKAALEANSRPSETDEIIKSLFSSRWSGRLAQAPVSDMRKQLHKTLTDQANGYWSGNTAYHIAVDGGFLVDSKRERIDGTNMAKGKKLTALGERFMKSMEAA